MYKTCAALLTAAAVMVPAASSSAHVSRGPSTPFAIGRIDGPLTATTIYGDRFSVAIPPRTTFDDMSDCRWPNLDRVTYEQSSRDIRARWSADKTVERFGPVVFDGMNITNTSHTRWVNVYGVIFNGCSR